MLNQLTAILGHAGETHNSTAEAIVHANQADNFMDAALVAIKLGAILIIIVLVSVLFFYKQPSSKSVRPAKKKS